MSIHHNSINQHNYTLSLGKIVATEVCVCLRLSIAFHDECHGADNQEVFLIMCGNVQ